MGRVMEVMRLAYHGHGLSDSREDSNAGDAGVKLEKHHFGLESQRLLVCERICRWRLIRMLVTVQVGGEKAVPSE